MLVKQYSNPKNKPNKTTLKVAYYYCCTCVLLNNNYATNDHTLSTYAVETVLHFILY